MKVTAESSISTFHTDGLATSTKTKLLAILEVSLVFALIMTFGFLDAVGEPFMKVFGWA